MYIRPNLLWHYEIMNVRPAEWKLFFHVCPDPAQVGAGCPLFAWCEEKVEDKVLVEVQNESLF
jgi:hypothetical protein